MDNKKVDCRFYEECIKLGLICPLEANIIVDREDCYTYNLKRKMARLSMPVDEQVKEFEGKK